MKLYDLTGDFAELFERFDEIDNWEPDTDEDGKPIDDNGNVIKDVKAYKEAMLQAWFNTLEGIEELFEDKAVNIAMYIKNLRSDAEQLKAEKLRLEKRQSSKNKAADRLEEYLFNSMQAIGRTVIDRPQALITIQRNPESTVIDDERRFIEWAESTNHDNLLKYEQPTIRKNDVKALIRKEDKENVPKEQRVKFAHLERKTVLKIK
jgi:hypothetical protein